MTVRRTDDTIILDGTCPAEDAEQLLQMLQATGVSRVDWTHSRQIHTAILQVILAARVVPVGPCGDPWIQQWLATDIQ
jgi:hypothetical protein